LPDFSKGFLKKDANTSETQPHHSRSFWQRHQFWLFLLVAVIIRQIPLVSIPFNWLESYFHEISHGIAALVSGGDIIRIQLFANGAGLCTTQGGSRFSISFFGYGGAIIWGGLIYSFSGQHQRFAQLSSAFIAVLLLSSILLWARDLLTIIILLVLFIMFGMTIKLQKLKALQMMMQLFGLLVLLNSLFSPSYLLDGRNLGDGAALAELTFIPEIVWVAIWSLMALGVLYALSKVKSSKKIA
jgi:hypothetical protein